MTRECMHNATMASSEPKTVSLSIRHVPLEARNALVARAAQRGQSLQEYLLALIGQHVAQPTREELFARIRASKAAIKGGGVSLAEIRRALDEGRDERDRDLANTVAKGRKR